MKLRISPQYPKAIKGVKRYDEKGEGLPKTVGMDLKGSVALYPAVTNPQDATAAGDDLPAEELWQVTAAKGGWVEIAYAEDGSILLTAGEKAVEGKSIKVTVKAKDGSNKSASVTIKFQ